MHQPQPGKWRRRSCLPWWAGLCLAVAIAASPCAAAEPASLEFPIKVSFLEKFGDFIAWPAGTFERTGGVFQICIFGADPFGGLADRLADGHKSANHVIAVRRIQSPEEAALCQVLYFGGSDPRTVANVLRAVRGQPVLTVTDERNGADPRGIIHFVLEENHVRFAIDDESAAANGLGISSKLLSVATSVTLRRKEAAP